MTQSNQSKPGYLSRGLRQRELCEHLGMNYREVAQAARKLGLSTHAYIQQQTQWQLRDELYYPPEEKCGDPNDL